MFTILTRKRKLRLTEAVIALVCLTHVTLAEEGCGSAPEKPHARHNGTGDTYPPRALVYYTCQRGFYQNGFPGAVCYKGSWVGHPLAPFTCVLKSCNSPGLIDNGEREGFVFSVGATVKYSCYEGYEIKGSAVRMCLASTSWSGKKPSCVPVRCPRLPPPRHGKIQSDSLEYGSTARVTCDEGYRLIGSETRSCQADKTWSGDDSSCNEIECKLPTIESGTVAVETPIKYGMIAIFSCDVGMTLVGKKTAVCVEDNEWSQTFPKCIDTCEVPDVTKGKVRQRKTNYYNYPSYIRIDEDRVESGTSLYVTCDWHYSLSPEANTYGGYRKITCVDGAWDSVPKCKARSCTQTPSQLTHGFTQYDGLEHGSRIRYSCDPGYTLSSHQNRTCNFGKWTGRNPWCKKNYCSRPRDLPEGMELMAGQTASRYDHNAVLRLKCSEGYSPSVDRAVHELTCYNTTWKVSGDIRCEHAPCLYKTSDKEEIVSGVDIITNGRFSHNSDIEIKCSDVRKFQLKDGISRAKCRYGEWKPAVPSCEPASCTRGLSPLKHGFMQYDGLAHGSSVQYSCQLGYTLTRHQDRTCEFGRWTGRKPKCQENYCSYPRDLPEGMELMGDQRSTEYNHNSTLRLQCSDGYRPSVDGSSLEWTCYNTTWNTSGHLQCLRETLKGDHMDNAPVAASDGLREFCSYNASTFEEIVSVTGTVGGKFSHSSSLEITCRHAARFHLKDSVSKAICDHGEWKPRVPGCQPNLCEELHNISHGKIIYKDDDTVRDTKRLPHLTTAELVCDPGYRTAGSKTTQCVYGRWSEQSSLVCDPVGSGCQDPGDIENAYKTSEWKTDNGYYPSGEFLMYECFEGFLFDDISRIQEIFCLEDGTWSDLLLNCTALKCDQPQSVEGGSYTPVKKKYSYNDTVTFSCEDPKQVAGPAVLTCTEHGLWDNTEPECKVPQCPVLPWPKNGRRVGNGRRAGDMVSFECNAGYTLQGSSERTCQAREQWDGETTACVVTQCPQLPSPENGRRLGSGLQVGNKVSFECNAGYSVQGSSERTCQASGEWNGETTRCVLTQCPELPSPENGRRLGGGRQVGDPVSFECNAGYSVQGSSERTCQASGEWNGETTRCVLTLCPELPRPQNGRRLGSSRQVGDKVSFECNAGYSVQGSSERTCQASGEWNGETTRCVLTLCPELPRPQNGRRLGSSRQVGDKVSFECNAGYSVQGSSERICQASGDWNGQTTRCVLTLCPELPSPENGRRLGGGRQVGNKVSFECNAGYSVQGSSQRTCQASGEWNGETTRCVLSQCPELPIPENGRRYGNGVQIGDKVSFDCANGYSLQGSYERICQTNQKWDGETTSCVGQCPYLDTPENGRREGYGHNVGDKVSFQCEKGYVMQGSQERVCQANKQWDGETTRCVVEETGCPKLPFPENGRRVGNRRQVGDKVDFVCNDGYTLQGSYDRTCQANQQWDGETTRCVKQCPYLPFPKNGRRVGYDRNVGDKVKFECYKGYALRGSGERVCQANQQWDGETTSCVQTQCPDLPRPENGRRSGYGRQVGDRVRFECYAGYALQGSRERVCQTSQQWDGETTRCVGTQCPYLSSPENGRLMGYGRQIGDRVSFECYAGFTLQGSRERVCQSNKQWDGETTRCLAESAACVVPSAGRYVISAYRDVNGRRLSRGAGNTVKAGSFMLSRCERFDTMYFTGDSKRVCENGQWTGQEPKCSYIRLKQGKYSQRNYADWSNPRRGITVSDEGHLRVKKGSATLLSCHFVGSEQLWSSVRGLQLSDMVLKADQLPWSGQQLYTSKLKITDADEHHSDTYFCSTKGESIPTATFTIKVV